MKSRYSRSVKAEAPSFQSNMMALGEELATTERLQTLFREQRARIGITAAVIFSTWILTTRGSTRQWTFKKTMASLILFECMLYLTSKLAPDIFAAELATPCSFLEVAQRALLEVKLDHPLTALELLLAGVGAGFAVGSLMIELMRYKRTAKRGIIKNHPPPQIPRTQLTGVGPFILLPIKHQALGMRTEATARTYSVRLGAWCLRALRREMPNMEAVGRLSPMSNITIDAVEVRTELNIPEGATMFAFAYPLPGAEERTYKYPKLPESVYVTNLEVRFCLFGGYVYFDQVRKGTSSAPTSPAHLPPASGAPASGALGSGAPACGAPACGAPACGAPESAR